MKKRVTLIITLLLFNGLSFAQISKIDSLKNELHKTKSDTVKVLLLSEIGAYYEEIEMDSMLYYHEEALRLARKSDFRIAEISSTLGDSYRLSGNFPKAFEYLFEALKIATNENDYEVIGRTENRIAIVYSQLDDDPNAIIHQKRAIIAFEIAKNYGLVSNSTVNLGRGFRRNNQLDSAAFYFQKAYAQLDLFRNKPRHAFLMMEMGQLEFTLNNQSKAFDYLRESIRISEKGKFSFFYAFACNTMADILQKTNQIDSSRYYAEMGYQAANKISSSYLLLESSRILAALYDGKDLGKENFYLKKLIELNNDLHGAKKVQELQKTLSEEQARQRKQEEERLAEKNKIRQFGFLIGLSFLAIVVFLLYRNNRTKHKDNILLQKQKEEIESTLTQLKATQTQLIQSEKMASLGELTAGIAHEIQNPLNFVNNFSEVSAEMIEELDEELEKGDLEEVKAISGDLKQNLSKINHHGNRASSIVKGMLEHSRKSTGKKELTDINALADEYLRLSYHGLRAKDRSFNANFKTDFAAELPKIKVIPQDIGRVLLNLINNGFQAVDEQAKKGIEGYKPTLAVTTKTENGQVLISLKDNGPGIPDAIKDKIFQPFFTTKPTGKGTGLGLSLAYDIVKAHGGELTVKSEDNNGTVFTIKFKNQAT